MNTIIYILMCVLYLGVMLAMVLVVFRDKKTISNLLRLKEEPTFYRYTLKNPEILSTVLELLPKLSIDEQELVIARIFGRPINVHRSTDGNGLTWFTAVTPFQVDGDLEKEFFYDKLKTNLR